MQNNQTIGILQYNVRANMGFLNLQSNFAKVCTLNFALLDEKGRVIFEQKINQTENNTAIQLQTPPLKTGKYNAWIQAEGKTYLRQLSIEKAPRHSWSEKIKSWLSFPYTQPIDIILNTWQ